LRHGHGRTNAESPRRIGTGSDHAALIRLAADSERFAAQGRITAFFDSTEKSIEVEV
jgi:hypothetical protein